MAMGLKFWIEEIKGLYYLCSENKSADQLLGYCTADLRLCFSHMQKAGFLMTWLKLFISCFFFLLSWLSSVFKAQQQNLFHFHVKTKNEGDAASFIVTDSYRGAWWPSGRV